VPNVVDREDRLASAQNRSQLFWLLAEGLLAGPWCESWLLLKNQATTGDDDAGDPLATAWRNMIGALNGLDKESPGRLAVEHTRLVGGLGEGNGPPPPFESAWRSAFEPGEVALAVGKSYAAAGFADIDLDAGPQDHLGVELKFMALLALREAEAWRQGDVAEAETRILQQRTFLDNHLLEWVPRWADGFAQQTREPLFLAFAALLWEVLNEVAGDLRMLS
jgi:putative dimethyl sulfoxide reductase chaperone